MLKKGWVIGCLCNNAHGIISSHFCKAILLKRNSLSYADSGFGLRSWRVRDRGTLRSQSAGFDQSCPARSGIFTVRLRSRIVSNLMSTYVEVLVGELRTQAHHFQSPEEFVSLFGVFFFWLWPWLVVFEFRLAFGVFGRVELPGLPGLPGLVRWIIVPIFEVRVGGWWEVVGVVPGLGIVPLFLDDFVFEVFLGVCKSTLARCVLFLSLSCLMRSSKDTSAMSFIVFIIHLINLKKF